MVRVKRFQGTDSERSNQLQKKDSTYADNSGIVTSGDGRN